MSVRRPRTAPRVQRFDFSDQLEVRTIERDYDTTTGIAVFRRLPDDNRQILILRGEWVPYDASAVLNAADRLQTWEFDSRHRAGIIQKLGDLALQYGYLPNNDRVAGELAAQTRHVAELSAITARLLGITERGLR